METISRPETFRAYLQQELIRRCRNNPKYSLRAFSNSLNTTSGALTEMLNGKRTITKKTIEKLGLRLGLSMEEINHYLSSKESSVEAVSNKESNYRQITIDQYSLISDWYHYAIIELVKVKSFKTDNAWIARSLGITKSEANIAVERLLRLGLLVLDENGELKDTSEGFSTNISGNLTSVGSRQLQKQILQQSITAIETVSIELRNHTSMTMAIDPTLLPEAIKRIAKFRRELCEYLESQGTPTEVYQLAVSLFPISNTKESIVKENTHEKV